MDIIEILPRLRFIRFGVGYAYLWRDPDGLTLIDAGLPGPHRIWPTGNGPSTTRS